MRRNRAPLTARQRAERRNRIFRPVNTMPELILRAQRAHAFDRMSGRITRRAAISAIAQGGPSAGTPLTDAERVFNYGRQNGNVYRPLTARQQRRRVHKARKHQFSNLGVLEAHRAALAR